MADLAEHLVGRAAELDALDTALARGRAGRRGAIELVGEPGIGKTRLLAELAPARRRARTSRARRPRVGARARPAVLGLRRRAGRVRRKGSTRGASRVWTTTRGRSSRTSSRLLSLAPAAGTSLQHERYRTHRAVRELLELLAATKPLVLVARRPALGGLRVGRAARRAAAPTAGGAGAAGASRCGPAAPGAAVPAALERAQRDGALARIELGALRRRGARAPRTAGRRRGGRRAVRGERRQPVLPRAARRARCGARGRATVEPGRPAGRRRGAAGRGRGARARSSRCSPGRPAACWRARRWRATRSSSSWPPAAAARRRGARRSRRSTSCCAGPRPSDGGAAALPLPAPARAPRGLRGHARRLAARARTSEAPRRWRRAARRRARARTTSSAPRAQGDAAAVALLREAGDAAAQRAPASAARWFAAALRLLPAHRRRAQERVELLRRVPAALARRAGSPRPRRAAARPRARCRRRARAAGAARRRRARGSSGCSAPRARRMPASSARSRSSTSHGRRRPWC